MTLRDAGPAAAAGSLTIMAAAFTGGATDATVPAVIGFLPTVVAAAWIHAALTTPGAVWVWSAAGIGLGLGELIAPGAALAQAAWVAGGLLAGAALRRGRRADAALVLVVMPAAVLVLAAGAPVLERVLAEYGRQFTAMLERSGATGSDQAAREAATAQARRMAEVALQTLRRVWPAVIALSLLAHAAVAVLAARWLAGRRRGAPGLAPWPPPREWRLPFYLVWVLVLGLALLVTRQATAARIGVNVIIVAGAVCSVQGFAVTAGLLHRAVAPWLQFIIGVATVLLMAPLVLPAMALVGLLDQWVDFRRVGAGGAQSGP